MLRKNISIISIILIVVAVLAFTANADKTDKSKIFSKNQVSIHKDMHYKIAGAERPMNLTKNYSDQQSFGAGDIQSNSPGMQIGTTSIDIQSISRMNRQVGHRGTEMVHFNWTKQVDSVLGGDRGTGYNAWHPVDGELSFGPTGCDYHPRLGSGVNISEFVSLDVDTEGKVVAANHHDEGLGYATTIWYDFVPGACFFSPYRRRLPDSLMCQITDVDYECEYIWPSHDYQVWNGDTVTHVFAKQLKEATDRTFCAYFRRVGSDTLGAWDYPATVIDTIEVVSQTVTSSRTSGNVALVWAANIPETPGDPESANTGTPNNNDLFHKLSSDMGASWEPNENVTANQQDEGWHLQGDLSALYSTEDYLHIIWSAREVVPYDGGTFTHFYGSRLFHWSNRSDQASDPIRVIKDANWDIPDQGSCYGSMWNDMSIVKMSISECDGKMYATFCQFQDPPNGIIDDCHEDAFTGGNPTTANGEVYVSISDNWGFNWDIARNITNTYTPHCQEGVFECESDVWPSAARFGMENAMGDFTDAIVVDISGGYTGNNYLDITYINDKYGGSCVHDTGVWTTNSVKWVRIPCVEPLTNSLSSFSPTEIDDPAWTKPGVQLDTVVTLYNFGNAPLNISTVSYGYISGSGWLSADVTADINISHLTPNYFNLGVALNAGGVISSGPNRVEGYLIFESNSNGGSIDSFYVSLIVADSVQFPLMAQIRTDCKRINWNNAGNIGDGGNWPDGGYNMDFFDDCDTTGNTAGMNDNVSVYLYEASPFVLRIDGDDTLLSYYMFDADWLTDDGFRPLDEEIVDSITFPDYQYGYTGRFCTQDTSITVDVEYFAPTHPDSCGFIIVKERFYNTSGHNLYGVYVGDIYDWDIPSDTLVANGSGYEAPGGYNSLDLMYCYGGEYSEDEIINNDCIYADMRMGGMAFYNGYKFPWVIGEEIDEWIDSLENPAGPWWTYMNADWVHPTGGLIGGQLYRKMEDMGNSWETWEATAEGSTNPDSMFQDLHMVSVLGKFDLTPMDTLVFVKILATDRDGLTGLKDEINKARAWIGGRPILVFDWPERIWGPCCDTPGDMNGNGMINILDITFLISYLYKGGPAPSCLNEADVNNDCAINIQDITYLIQCMFFPPWPPCELQCGCVDDN